MKKLIFLLVLPLFILSACNKDETSALSYDEQLAVDINIIEDYLADNSLVAMSTVSGLHYIVEVEGAGDYPTLSSTVEIQYEGSYLDGEVFDDGTFTTDSYHPISGLISGFREGVLLFRGGSSGKLYIPSGLAYGPLGSQGIPANTVLIFDITLISVTN